MARVSPEVFVSYSSKDRQRVLELVDQLRASGVSVWMDQEGIAGARVWSEEIVRAICGARVVLLALSRSSARSRNVAREVRIASEEGKNILPIKLDATPVPKSLRYQLAGIQHVDLFSGPPEAALAVVLRALRRAGIRVSERRDEVPPALPAGAGAAAGRPDSLAPGQQAPAFHDTPSAPVPHNLPVQLTPFIGREGELREIGEFLTSQRLVTLAGPGGSGKSRLALKAAELALHQFPDGVWLAELGALNEPALVPQTVAAAVGISEESGQSITQTMVEFLRARRALIILDNCEHLIDAVAPFAESLLRTCPHLKLLATSREVLGIPGEAPWSVPPLSLPASIENAGGSEDLLSTILNAEAVQFFADRAAAAAPGFQVTSANAATIARLCRRLDGIPLALELAAARVRVLNVEQLTSRLNDRFRLLTGGSRTGLPRQQTLRATIDWSYELLTPAERALVRRLSVFAGGWTLEAAEEITAGDPVDTFDILDLLSRLIDKSLVTVQVGRTGETRYGMLESLREYNRERLEEAGETENLRSAHRQYYLHLAERAEPELRGPEQAHWIALLAEEHDNLRQAIQSSAEALDVNTALGLAASLWRFWSMRCLLGEGRERLRQCLTLPGAEGPTVKRARSLNGAGALAQDQGELAAAHAYHLEALGIARQVEDRESEAVALNNLGNVALGRGDYNEARSRYETALSIWRDLGNRQGVAMLLTNLGSLAHEQGDDGTATEYFVESIEIKKTLRDQAGVANSLNNLAHILLRTGDYPRAESLLLESLDLFRKLQNQHGEAMCLANLAALAHAQRDCRRAATLHTEALIIWDRLGSRQAMPECIEGLGRVFLTLEQAGNGVRLLGAAQALREAMGLSPASAERDMFDQTLGSVGPSMALEEFRHLWEEGYRMEPAEVVAWAVRQVHLLTGA